MNWLVSRLGLEPRAVANIFSFRAIERVLLIPSVLFICLLMGCPSDQSGPPAFLASLRQNKSFIREALGKTVDYELYLECFSAGDGTAQNLMSDAEVNDYPRRPPVS